MPQIKLIFNLPDRDSPLGRILGELCQLLEGVRILPIGALDGFSDALSLNPTLRTLAVLSLEDTSDLISLGELTGLIRHTDLIFLIPEGDDQLMKEDRKLRPRYIAALPAELSNLPLIIEAAIWKMQRLTAPGSTESS